jgi:hypothetical protein
MEFELIEDAAIKPGIDQSIVLVAFLILLPLEVDEGVGGILLFDPYGSGLEHSSNQIFVIPLSQVKLMHKIWPYVVLLFVVGIKPLNGDVFIGNDARIGRQVLFARPSMCN